jgi:hypothetical protein
MLFTVAKTLGKTVYVYELETLMPPEELFEWVEFFRLERERDGS